MLQVTLDGAVALTDLARIMYQIFEPRPRLRRIWQELHWNRQDT